MTTITQARPASAPKSGSSTAQSATSTKPKPQTKIARVITLLERKNGATLEELTQATGWQSHSVRAALTGLKKKGHTIERSVVDGVSRYTIGTPS